jgi:hypothetical protein
MFHVEHFYVLTLVEWIVLRGTTLSRSDEKELLDGVVVMFYVEH